ncbi:MAG: hypothetical protein JWP38_226 [Herbaspirillum sp.]|nr:hypothetical protein [Herbaspirillum sp.]
MQTSKLPSLVSTASASVTADPAPQLKSATVYWRGRKMVLMQRPQRRRLLLLRRMLKRSGLVLSGRLARAIATSAMATAAIAAHAGAPVVGSTLPAGAVLQAGQATVSQVGNQMAVVQSTDKAIIDWQSFSIGSQAGVNFSQPGVNSATLNRVVGADPSQLLGSMTANGKIFLINAAGILVGAGAKIDVGGFVGSTLDISNADFLANKLNFNAGAATPAGVTVEKGAAITTPEGGSVYLLGSSVQNSGVITSPGGEVLLAAGSTVQLVDTGTPGVTIDVTGAEGNVTNLGEIIAAAGRIGIGAALIDNSGTLNASSVEKQGGQIFLRASKQLVTEASSKIDAGGASGGNVVLYSDQLANIGGDVAALGSGGAGGYVETSGKTSLTVQYVPRVGANGTWYIDPYDIHIVASGTEGGTAPPTGGVITSTGSTAVILASTISAMLNSGTSVSVVTGADGTTTGGTITLDAGATISKADGTRAATLTLNAVQDIVLNGAITDANTGANTDAGVGGLSLVLNAGFTGSGNSIVPTSTGNVAANASIKVTGGLDVNALNFALQGSSNTLTLSGNSVLNATSSIANLSQISGDLVFKHNLTVTHSLTLTAGTISSAPGSGTLFTATGSVFLVGGSMYLDQGSFTQNSGVLSLGNISSPISLALTALDGAIEQQSNTSLTTASLTATATAGIALTSPHNTVGIFAATNTGSGDISLTNYGRMAMGSIVNYSGDVTVNNGGAISFMGGGGIQASNGTVTLNAAGPLEVIANGITARNIDLTSTSRETGDEDILINGPMTASGPGPRDGIITLNSIRSIVQAQSGAAITAAAVHASAISGIALNGSGNRISAFDANNGSGDILFTNTSAGTASGVLTTGAIRNGDTGNISIDNTGAMVTAGLIDAPAGTVSIATHSPLTIGVDGVSASGDVSLSAGYTGSAADNLVLNGMISSNTGNVTLFAGNNIQANAAISALNGSLNGTTMTGIFIHGSGFSSNPSGTFIVTPPVTPPIVNALPPSLLSTASLTPIGAGTNTVDQNVVTTTNNANGVVTSLAAPPLTTTSTGSIVNEQTIGGTSGSFGGGEDASDPATKPGGSKPLPVCT